MEDNVSRQSISSGECSLFFAYIFVRLALGLLFTSRPIAPDIG
jgi:hypothetical protein